MSSMARCVQCGDPLPPGALACGRCNTPALSSQALVKVPVLTTKRPAVPDACCCCLGPKEMERGQKVYVGPKRFFVIQVPWCRACKTRSTIAMALLVVGMFGGGFLGLLGVMLAGPPLGLSKDGTYGLGTLGLIVGLIVGAVLGLKVAKIMNVPGHVSRCNAVASMPTDGFSQGGALGGHLTFYNAAFARLWQERNP